HIWISAVQGELAAMAGLAGNRLDLDSSGSDLRYFFGKKVNHCIRVVWHEVASPGAMLSRPLPAGSFPFDLLRSPKHVIRSPLLCFHLRALLRFEPGRQPLPELAGQNRPKGHSK